MLAGKGVDENRGLISDPRADRQKKKETAITMD